MDNLFKTKPFNHQIECLAKFGRHVAFALLAEQGTGKTKIIIDNVAQLWASGDCNGLIVFAPNGVHHNWVLREMPVHMPDWVRFRMAAWSAGANKKDQRRLSSLFEGNDSSELRILCMNSEGLQHKRSTEFAEKFAQSCSKLMIVADESTDFKNPSSARTKSLMKMKKFSTWRRIMNGTPVPNGPFDAFSQFAFLDESILQTTSYYAFKAEYAEILQEGHPLLDHIMGKKTKMTVAERGELETKLQRIKSFLVENGRQELIEIGASMVMDFRATDYDAVLSENDRLRNSLGEGSSKRKLALLFTMGEVDRQIVDHQNAVARSRSTSKRIPQVVERDKTGAPKYKNLEKLQALIAPHSFRVLKKDCLDLPDKIYKTVWFDLTPTQQEIYDKAEKENRLALDGEDTVFNKLVAQMKLMQITSGYYLHPEAVEPVRIGGENPKLELLAERACAVVEAGEKLIVWARYRVQIEDVCRSLRSKGLIVVEYHGGISRSGREEAIESFERGGATVFVGQQQAGGRGLTLIAASNVFYYSNTYALDHRQQTEDRAHRIGQDKNVIYTDFCARDTVDYECIERLRSKEGVAAIVTGDSKQKDGAQFA